MGHFSKLSSSKVALITTTSIITASIGSFLIEFTPHTFFLNYYKKLYEYTRYGQPVPVDKQVEILFNSVLDDLKIHEKSKATYSAFTSSGFNLSHGGLGLNKFGIIIGIPINYTYNAKSDFNPSELCIGKNKDTLNIFHPAAEDLVDSLILSDKAKKFGIAREILMSQKIIPLYRSIETPVVITGTAFLAEFARTSSILKEKPAAFSFLIYSAIALLGYSMWFQIRDNLTSYYERIVDKELSELGPDYIEGGKEFYEKLLKKNIALRVLLGASGAKIYKRDGDELSFIRHKNIPLTHRQKFFNELNVANIMQEAA